MGSSCLLFTPRVKDDDASLGRQTADIEGFRGAIENANLEPPPDEELVVFVEDNVDPELIERLYAPDFVLIDANPYSGKALPSTLAYLLAARHVRDDRTLLLARSDDHLPRWLQRRNTLTYDPNKLFPEFFNKLKRTVEELLEGQRRPDNPIQTHFAEREQAAENADKDRRIFELERRVREQRARPVIQFRRVPEST